MVIDLAKFHPYPQTLDDAERSAVYKHSSLVQTFINYEHKKLNNICH